MTAEEIRNAMNESMKKIVNTENIINFHMDLIQKAFLEALSLGMKIGEANAKDYKWHFAKNGDLPKDGETVLVCRDDMQIWTGNRHSKRENSYFWYIHNLHGVLYKDSDIYAWKEIEPPEIEEE